MSANHNQQYLVSPKPAIVHDELAHIGAGLRFSQSPTNFLAELREQYGDTFLVDILGYKLFCVFSPAGLKSLNGARPGENMNYIAKLTLVMMVLASHRANLEVLQDCAA
ncbi:MAG: hypothetical protein P8J17_16275 [Halioglobus sp.]|nr:hypothetical protein [Halioglobus sp.]